MNILEKANQIINERSEEKEREYGPFIECNERAAKIASVLCNKEVTTLDIYHFQIALKLAREAYAHKEDNLLDAVAYLGALNNYHNGVEPTSKKKNQMKKNELKVKYFQYGEVLCDWVNGTCTIPNLKRDLSKTITVVSIASANKYQGEGEGFNLFYYEH